MAEEETRRSQRRRADRPRRRRGRSRRRTAHELGSSPYRRQSPSRHRRRCSQSESPRQSERMHGGDDGRRSASSPHPDRRAPPRSRSTDARSRYGPNQRVDARPHSRSRSRSRSRSQPRHHAGVLNGRRDRGVERQRDRVRGQQHQRQHQQQQHHDHHHRHHHQQQQHQQQQHARSLTEMTHSVNAENDLPHESLREQDSALAGSSDQGIGQDRVPLRGKRAGRGRGRGSYQPRVKGPKVSIPDNWTDVPKMGAMIATSRFVAMRVMLDDKYTRLIAPADESWTPQQFLQLQAARELNVRMVIDLTNTCKYYNGGVEFDDTPLQYVKLRIEGFKRPPSQADEKRFTEIVDTFLSQEPMGTIAVHCTHGLNRTGYLIVSYLVQRSGMTVREALDAFSVARPPGLIKHMYVQDLYHRFAPEEPVVLPQLPDWAASKYANRKH